MGRLILHAGVPKTGSKLIQKTLRANWRQLRRRGTYVVNRRPFDALAGGAHRRWRGGGAPLDALEPIWQELHTAVRANDAVLVSHEDLLGGILSFRSGRFYPTAQSLLGRCIEAVAPDDVQVIIFVRRQDTYLESVYLQLLRGAYARSFAEFYGELAPEGLSWCELLDRLAPVTGAERLVVRYSESITQSGTAYIRRFMDDARLGIEPEFPFDVEATHRGYSEVAMQLAVVANRLLDSHEERRKVRRFLGEHFTNRTHPKPCLLDGAERERILDLLADDNRRLHDEYVRKLESDVSYAPQPR